LKYSFLNLHEDFEDETLKHFKSSVEISIEQNKILENYYSKYPNKMIEEKINKLKTDLNREQALIQQMENAKINMEEIKDLNKENKILINNNKINEENKNKKQFLKKQLHEIIKYFESKKEIINFHFVFEKLMNIIKLVEEEKMEDEIIEENLIDLTNDEYNTKPVTYDYFKTDRNLNKINIDEEVDDEFKEKRKRKRSNAKYNDIYFLYK
jgi:hypothetical protein